MLGKLIKNDLKELGIYYLPLYLIYVGISAAFGILLVMSTHIQGLNDNALFHLLMIVIAALFIIGSCAVFILSGLILLYYFYRKFVSEEAYLTMTLPVKPWQHIFSKMIAGAVWKLISYLVFLLSIFLILNLTGIFQEAFRQINFSLLWNSVWINLQDVLEINALSVGLGILNVIISLFTGSLVYFAALSIGQMAGKHKIFMAVVAYVVLDILTTVVSGGILNIPIQSVSVLLLISAMENILFSVIYFGITVYFLDKQLNLE